MSKLDNPNINSEYLSLGPILKELKKVRFKERFSIEWQTCLNNQKKKEGIVGLFINHKFNKALSFSHCFKIRWCQNCYQKICQNW